MVDLDPEEPDHGSLSTLEQKVLVHLDTEEREAASWALDTEATNHMSGS